MFPLFARLGFITNFLTIKKETCGAAPSQIDFSHLLMAKIFSQFGTKILCQMDPPFSQAIYYHIDSNVIHEKNTTNFISKILPSFL